MMQKTNKIYSTLLFLLLSMLVLVSCENSDKSYFREKKRDAVLANISAPAISENKISILDFGAAGDSLTDCKLAFEKAMAYAKDNDGAHIIVPRGTFLVNGPIHFESNVCLEIQKGARIKFNALPESFLPTVLTSYEGTRLYNYSPFIYAYNKKNISIIGKGVIDGNSNISFGSWNMKQEVGQKRLRKMNEEGTPLEERQFGAGYFLRPQLIQFYECENILIQDVHLKNSPFWCVHMLYSQNIIIQGIRHSTENINNDGVVLESCENALVEDIIFKKGDDNISIKAGRNREARELGIPSKNIIIRDCKFCGLNGVVIGSEISGGIENIFIENCGHTGFTRRGIFLKTNPDRGGYIRNVFVKDIELGETDECFTISTFYHGEGEQLVSEINDIYLENISCQGTTRAGVTIHGFPSRPVKNIYLKNVKIKNSKLGISLIYAENVVLSNVIIGTLTDTIKATKY